MDEQWDKLEQWGENQSILWERVDPSGKSVESQDQDKLYEGQSDDSKTNDSKRYEEENADRVDKFKDQELWTQEVFPA